jgi:hypothetical protein
LKADKRTQRIPVIVVSARDITLMERQFLTGQIEGLYQKATMSPRKFVDDVVHMLDEKTGHEEPAQSLEHDAEPLEPVA